MTTRNGERLFLKIPEEIVQETIFSRALMTNDGPDENRTRNPKPVRSFDIKAFMQGLVSLLFVPVLVHLECREPVVHWTDTVCITEDFPGPSLLRKQLAGDLLADSSPRVRLGLVI